jgi:hypothetical protein
VEKIGGMRKEKGEATIQKWGSCRSRPATNGCLLAAARSLLDYEQAPFFHFFAFFQIFFWVIWKWAWHFGRMGVQHPHFLKLVPTLGRVKSSIPYGTWRFHVFFYKKLAKIRVYLDLHIHH